MDSEARKYEMVSNQEEIENNNSECFALQIYRPNYLSPLYNFTSEFPAA